MSVEPIRAFIVDADPNETDILLQRAGELEDMDVVGVAHNRRSATDQLDSLQVDVLVVDLMLPGFRSIDLVRKVARDHPQVRILALSPDDPPHDRIMLAAEAGALGFVSRQTLASELSAAIHAVQQGQPWLPPQQTYEILQDGAGELALSSQERRSRLGQVILGLIPLTGLIAAITGFLWREYWGAIGVRVADLGIDPSTRMIDVVVVLVMIIGIFGPLLFVRPWLKFLGEWIGKNRPAWANKIARLRGVHLGKVPIGKLITNYWVAWLIMMGIVLSITLLLSRFLPLILVLFVGPVVGIILIANVLDLDDELPSFLHLPHLDSWRILGFLGTILIVFLLALGIEVLILGPDLRPDGLHGILAPEVLGFGAKPVMVYDLDEHEPPLGALYLGGNADLYVLFDPCAETVRFVPVGSSRVDLIDRVDCRSP